jgi:hypothetical protein
MSAYTDHAKARADAAAPTFTSRLSIARRPPLDLPLAAAGGHTAQSAFNGQGAMSMGTIGVPAAEAIVDAPAEDVMRLEMDADASSTFDVPAFLRRQDN